MNTVEWDDPQKVETEFPVGEYEYIPVRSSHEARMAVATRCWTTQKVLIGEARWYGPGNGVIILKKEIPQAPTTAPAQKAIETTPLIKAESARVPWWRRWWPF